MNARQKKVKSLLSGKFDVNKYPYTRNHFGVSPLQKVMNDVQKIIMSKEYFNLIFSAPAKNDLEIMLTKKKTSEVAAMFVSEFLNYERKSIN